MEDKRVKTNKLYSIYSDEETQVYIVSRFRESLLSVYKITEKSILWDNFIYCCDLFLIINR